VRVSNCSINSPWDDAICLKSSYGLGFARATERVTITNCSVSGSFEEGALLDGTFRRFAPDFQVPRTGRIKFGTESNGGFKNITISNVVFDGCQGLALETVDGGLLEDVKLSDIYVQHRGGGTDEMAAIVPPEMEDAYPEPGMFGPMPAHGLYVRHARNIEVTNFEVVSLETDARPAIAMLDVRGADLTNVRTTEPPAGVPIMTLEEVEDLRVEGSEPLADLELDRIDKRSF